MFGWPDYLFARSDNKLFRISDCLYNDFISFLRLKSQLSDLVRTWGLLVQVSPGRLKWLGRVTRALPVFSFAGLTFLHLRFIQENMWRIILLSRYLTFCIHFFFSLDLSSVFPFWFPTHVGFLCSYHCLVGMCSLVVVLQLLHERSCNEPHCPSPFCV